MNICGKAPAAHNATVSSQRFGKFGDLRYAQGRPWNTRMFRMWFAAKTRVSARLRRFSSLSHVPNQIRILYRLITGPTTLAEEWRGSCTTTTTSEATRRPLRYPDCRARNSQ
jgi:hypothetical protein